MRLATYGVASVVSFFGFFKFGAWIFTQSFSLLSTLVDLMLGVGASYTNLLVIRHALVPADKEHRFGCTTFCAKLKK
jgi:ferrous-iron efflux pump FieF